MPLNVKRQQHQLVSTMNMVAIKTGFHIISWFCCYTLVGCSVIHNVTFGPTSLMPDNITALEDNSTVTCTAFQSVQNKASKLRIDLSLGAGNHSIDVVGTGLGCSQSPGGALYLIALTPEQTSTWFGRWETCTSTSQPQGRTDICRFACFCKETCPQLQLDYRPYPGHTTYPALCGITISTFRDCQEINDDSGVSQIYTINLNMKPTPVLCNMTADGGGWTVLMLRKTGSVDFTRNWLEYKDGFGDLSGDFWLGNEKMYQLTSDGRNYILSVEGVSFEGQHYKAQYDHFTISDENDEYRLNFGTYIGGTDNAFQGHKGSRFSTLDQDNDVYGGSCADTMTGSWWYYSCFTVKLTGLYGSSHSSHGIRWSNANLKYVDMKIRPAQ